MQTIPAAVSFDIRKTEVRELPLPDIAADAGLLRIEMTGVCGSDWPYYLKYPKTKGALVLGHESVGRIERLGREIVEALQDPAIIQKTRDFGAEPMPLLPAAYDAFMAAEVTKWAPVVAAAGATVD